MDQMYQFNAKQSLAACQCHRRNGSSYILVLAIVSVASLAAYALLSLATSNRNRSELEADFIKVNYSLESSLVLALESLESDTGWRTSFGNNTTEDTAVELRINDTSLRWYVTDPVDGDLADDPDDPVEIHGLTQSGATRRKVVTTAFPAGAPLDVLRCPLHATGDIELSASAIMAGGPLSADSEIVGDSNSVFGTIESPEVSGLNGDYHSLFQTTNNKTMPSDKVFAAYRALATEVDLAELPGRKKINDRTVSNQSAPADGLVTNPDGVYFFDVPDNRTLQISNCKISGTFLVRLSGNKSKLKVDQDVVWHPLRRDFPSLIVYCETDSNNKVDIICEGTFTNPVDGSQETASLNGLFHIRRPAGATSKTCIRAAEPIRGSIIADGNVLIKENSYLTADPSLLVNPPIGYQKADGSETPILNGSFNAGLAPWYPVGFNFNGGGTRLERSTDSNDGSTSVRITRRVGIRQGIEQDITNRVINGDSTYGYLYARMSDQEEDLVIQLIKEDETGLSASTLTRQTVTTQWTPVSFSLDVSWQGTLTSARLLISTSSSNQDFLLDEISLSPTTTSTPRAKLNILPGSIRLE